MKPVVGAEPVVPIIAISAMFSNSSRVTAFLRYADWRRAGIVLVAAVPMCVLGAWGCPSGSSTTVQPTEQRIVSRRPEGLR